MTDNPTHTHYNPYGPPAQVPGTLLDCDDTKAHDPRHSEIFADYLYAPRLVPSADTGLPAHVEHCLHGAFLEHKADGLHFAMTDVSRDGDAYEAVFTSRYTTGDGWHQVRYRYEGGDAQRAVPNPHPGYEHWPAFCPNCGY